MSLNAFKLDRLQIGLDDLKAGRIERRDFLKLAGALGLSVPLAGVGLGAGDALAQAKEIVVSNFGGDAATFMAEAWGAPFTRDSGTPVSIVGGAPLPGKIRAQVDERNVIWDVCDADGFIAIDLGRKGYLEPIDYSVVDKSMIREGWAWEHGIANYGFSFVIAYDASKMGGKAPTGWADFYDVEKYPGKRTLWKYMMGAAEGALLADGVAPEDLYPLDMDRAIAKMRTIKDHLIFWDSGSETQQMFLDGEIVMGCIYSTRSSVLERDTGGRVKWIWEGANYCPGAWVVPKGNPAGAKVQQFIASTLIPERQIVLLDKLGNSPSNPAASALLTAEQRRIDPGYPENLAKQVIRDELWYADHYDDALNKWIDAIAG
ncbi:ABC transporter substrate-binding protein [Skermanella stibiiresistens SB22]|uniref:ABC transporter substrate-binding protein n=1 Tax=Skermanella stibiiresistens SB22 TaxID=1385369 RepID=W9HCI7_9PROT|nr:ABC transporter substrate-binding protein [Skermanella stibiiresistens]EWY41603.1 ABC transporter substrate-binding protein [Skermanella stibiiresistens SB22]